MVRAKQVGRARGEGPRGGHSTASGLKRIRITNTRNFPSKGRLAEAVPTVLAAPPGIISVRRDRLRSSGEERCCARQNKMYGEPEGKDICTVQQAFDVKRRERLSDMSKRRRP